MTLPDTLLAQISACINVEMGLNYPKERWGDLVRGLSPAAQEFGFNTLEAFGRWLVSTSFTTRDTNLLAKYLAVGETYFFRGRESFEALQYEIFPELIKKRRAGQRSLNIWSVGCSSGEEPYSIAILLHQLLPDIRRWDIRILGSDINTSSLRKAAQGIYSEWSFRALPINIRHHYFNEIQPGCYELIAQIKEMVTFSYLNLVKYDYPSLLNGTHGMDLILCRNVLIYFSAAHRMKVVRQLYHALLHGGWFLVSPTETPQARFSRFTQIRFPRAFVFLKEKQPLGIMDNAGKPAEVHPTASEPQKQPPESPSKSRMKEVNAPALYHQREPFPRTEQFLLNGKAYKFLAQTYACQGNIQEALKWIEKAIATDKLNPAFHFLHAKILQEQHLLKEALAAFRKTLYLEPNFVLAHFALGDIARRQKRTKDALKHFNNVLTLLQAYNTEDILPGSSEITAWRLEEIIESLLRQIRSQTVPITTVKL